MSIAQQICYNGEYFQENIPILTNRNRAFKYGDSLFETIHANGTRLQFFEDHFIRLQKGMNTLKMIANSDFNPITIEKEIIRLLNKNKLYQGARIRLSIFRKDGGFYTPINNQIDYLIEATALELDCYKLNQKGLRIGLFADISKSINCFIIKSTVANAILFSELYFFKFSIDCFIETLSNKIAYLLHSTVKLFKRFVRCSYLQLFASNNTL